VIGRDRTLLPVLTRDLSPALVRGGERWSRASERDVEVGHGELGCRRSRGCVVVSETVALRLPPAAGVVNALRCRAAGRDAGIA
jgi:hypothetical protein